MLRFLYWYAFFLSVYVFFASILLMIRTGMDIFGYIGLLDAPVLIFLIRIWRSGVYFTLDKRIHIV